MFFRKLCRSKITSDSVNRRTSAEHSDTVQYHIEDRYSFSPRTPPPSYSAGTYHLNRNSSSPSHPPLVDVRYVLDAGDRYSSDDSSSESDVDTIRRHPIQVNERFRPDLLRACSLLLPPQQSRDSPLDKTVSDHEKTDEICDSFSNIKNVGSAEDVGQTEGGCVTDRLTNQAMGQNLSLRRPRISLTWVLRDQSSSQQQQQSHNNNGPIDSIDSKKKLKSKNRDEKLFNEKYVSNHNLQEYQEKREPSKDLMFVCSPQKKPNGLDDAVTKRRQEIKRNLEKKSIKSSESNVLEKCDREESKSLKGTYSEPSLIAASEGNPRRHRHRKRRDRNRQQKFGYEIRNVDDFLTKCSLSSPGNIPVVLSATSTLYQTRPGGYQIEIPLPLGMVVNAVFKNQNWLYVQTPHAEEGYVGYAACLPLGILPPEARGNSTSKPTPCWETSGDVFPRPCGNMTDSEKEIRLRGGTRSDGARTPRLRRTSGKNCGEHHVDKLYLRAASQPKLTEKTYAQLKSTTMYKKQQSNCISSQVVNNDEYVQIQQKQKQVLQEQPKTNAILKQCPNAASTVNNKTKCYRQTLVAISNDYATDHITVQKGEIVTLVECRESKDRRQWFYIRTRDAREGFIPAEIAGHGFL